MAQFILDGWEDLDRILDYLLKKPLKKEIDFFQFAQKRVEELKKIGKISNAGHYEMVLRVFKEFYGLDSLPFADFDRALMNDFKISRMVAGLKRFCPQLLTHLSRYL